MTPAQQNQWMAQWRAAGAALDQVRREELSQLNQARNAQIAASSFVTVPPHRRDSQTSGLVEQQAIFLKARTR